MSCPDAIGKAIEKYSKIPSQPTLEEAMEELDTDIEQSAELANACPDCGAKIEREGGCMVCRICGFSKCS
jgi:ribonucleoside-diphosphate reductase alpha chain